MGAFESDAAVGLPTEAARARAGYRQPKFRRWMRELGWRYVVALAAVLFALFPLAWVATSSINAVDSLTTVSFFPSNTTTENYTDLFEGCAFSWGFPPFSCDSNTPVPTWLFNSVKIALIATVIQLACSALAAYSFARLRWRGRRTGLIAILLLQMFPQFLAFVAIFLLLDILSDTFGDSLQIPMILMLLTAAAGAVGVAAARARSSENDQLRRAAPWVIGGVGVLWVLGILSAVVPESAGSSWFDWDFGVTVFPSIGFNTHTGLILVYLGGAVGVNTWLIKGFMDSIPPSLDEAAKVDGATEWDVFSKIILPLTRPILVVIFILSFVGLYNEFILAQVLIRDVDQFTYATGLDLFVESEYAAKWGQLAAAAVIGSVPIIALFLATQDKIVGGLQGAVKG